VFYKAAKGLAAFGALAVKGLVAFGALAFVVMEFQRWWEEHASSPTILGLDPSMLRYAGAAAFVCYIYSHFREKFISDLIEVVGLLEELFQSVVRCLHWVKRGLRLLVKLTNPASMGVTRSSRPEVELPKREMQPVLMVAGVLFVMFGAVLLLSYGVRVNQNEAKQKITPLDRRMDPDLPDPDIGGPLSSPFPVEWPAYKTVPVLRFDVGPWQWQDFSILNVERRHGDLRGHVAPSWVRVESCAAKHFDCRPPSEP
jgi:hypothetical protein